ncbi:MAG: DUF3373 family protein [Sulfuricurvum sp.]|nr:DUF3373 family protein [Sulfuricurvum sp.]
MKKIVLWAVSTALFSSEITTEEKLRTLEAEIAYLKHQVQHNTEEIQDTLPILERVERKAILDKVDFTPELELRFDQLDYRLGEIENENTTVAGGIQRRDEFSKSFEPAGTVRFKLNMRADINDDLKFHGRMSINRSSQSNQRLCILSHDIKSSSSLTGMDVDRAYFDYTVSEEGDQKSVLTFGILPTSGGTPTQYSQNSTRKSMFPSLVFDMDSYGLIATQKLNNTTFLRAVIAKAFTLNPNMYIYQCNRENIDNATIAGAYFDTRLNFFGKAMLSTGINVLQDLKAHPYLGPDIDEANAHVLGNMITFGLGIDIEEVADQPLTLFAHTALSNPHGNGQKDDYKIVDTVKETTLSGQAGFTTADYASGEMLSANGYSIYLGGKYAITSALDIGAEYNHGSKYWFSATQGAEDIYNKLSTRGDVAEVYGIWQFHKFLYTKLGYLYTKENYTGSGWHFGEPAHKEGTQRALYLSIKAKF